MTQSMIAPPIVLERKPPGLRVERRRMMQVVYGTRRKPLGSLALALVVAIVLTAVFAGCLAPHDPTRMYSGTGLAEPGQVAPDGVPFILGADESDRDLFSRLIFGARISLMVDLFSVGAGTVLGTLIGLVSAFRADAARVLGASDQRIMLRHLLPNVMAPVMILATSALGSAILTEAHLSFLGLGMPPRRLRGESWSRARERTC